MEERDKKYQIVTSRSARELVKSVNKRIESGDWKPKGSHVVTILNETNRMSGMQVTGKNVDLEYSQTLIRV